MAIFFLLEPKVLNHRNCFLVIVRRVLGQLGQTAPPPHSLQVKPRTLTCVTYNK